MTRAHDRFLGNSDVLAFMPYEAKNEAVKLAIFQHNIGKLQNGIFQEAIKTDLQRIFRTKWVK